MKTVSNIKSYVETLLSNTNSNWYAKFARINARVGIVGEEIVTSVSAGNETANTVKEEGDMVVTNPGGEKYIIDAKTFAKKYEETSTAGTYKPKGGPQLFAQIQEDITFTAPWGAPMNIFAGGYLNVTNLDDIYGVNAEEFVQTYALCDEQGNFIN